MFAELFQIRKNSQFKQSNKITFNFIEWEIHFEEWNNFITFIKHGKIRDNNTEVIDNLNTFCNKIGGVPAFDDYYSKSLNSIKSKGCTYPYQDIYNEFNWIIIPKFNDKLYTYYDIGWNGTSNTTDCIILRKQK